MIEYEENIPIPDFLWRKCDVLNMPYYLSTDDFCIYAREHIAGGYEASPSNQHIFNFKKPISTKGTLQWDYKKHATHLFATELLALDFPKNSVLIPAPTSKPRNSELFDSRLDNTIQSLLQYRPDISFQPILDVITEINSSHSEGGSRNPDELEQYFIVNDFTNIDIPNKIFLVDDIITTGGHFIAAKRVLQRKYPLLNVIGIFWARRV